MSLRSGVVLRRTLRHTIEEFGYHTRRGMNPHHGFVLWTLVVIECCNICIPSEQYTLPYHLDGPRRALQAAHTIFSSMGLMDVFDMVLSRVFIWQEGITSPIMPGRR